MLTKIVCSRPGCNRPAVFFHRQISWKEGMYLCGFCWRSDERMSLSTDSSQKHPFRPHCECGEPVAEGPLGEGKCVSCGKTFLPWR